MSQQSNFDRGNWLIRAMLVAGVGILILTSLLTAPVKPAPPPTNDADLEVAFMCGQEDWFGWEESQHHPTSPVSVSPICTTFQDAHPSLNKLAYQPTRAGGEAAKEPNAH